MEQTIMTASKQWAIRPNDQRFISLEELGQFVEGRRRESWTTASPTDQLRIGYDIDNADELIINVFDPSHGETRALKPTNYAFGQLSQYAKAPASYIKTLPAPLAAINLQWGLENNPIREESLILGQSNGSEMMRAMTSTSYGRIWDIQVVNAVRRVNQDGNWVVPATGYSSSNPLRATTLYASDRDVFIFLVNPNHPIEVNGETLFRGFITWNSEVGSAVFGLTTFLYRYICDNRIVWGASEIKELRVKHTSGAPDRFAYEGAQYLKRYAEESTYREIETIKKAQRFELKKSDKEKDWAGWLKSRGFNGTESRMAVNLAEQEQGQARSLWDIVNGLTAYARSIPHTNERVRVESMAGNLLNNLN